MSEDEFITDTIKTYEEFSHLLHKLTKNYQIHSKSTEKSGAFVIFARRARMRFFLFARRVAMALGIKKSPLAMLVCKILRGN